MRSLAGYLDEVASAAPAPGGGSVAAIVGALGAALGEMVINLSVGRGGDAAEEATLRQAGEQLALLRAGLMAGAEEDERAYGTYRVAAAMPRGSADEKRARTAAMQQALITATEAPLAVARQAGEAAGALLTIARLGNPHLRSDAALGALLAEAALRGAMLNVRGNAGMVRDKARADAFLEEAERLESTGRADAQRAFAIATNGGRDASYR